MCIRDSLNGVVNINSGTVSENTNIYGGVLNLNGGTISGDLSLDPFFVTPQFNQNGGTLDLDNLSLDFVPGGGAEVTVGPGDNVSDSITVLGGKLTIDAELSLSSLFVSGANDNVGELVLNNSVTVDGPLTASNGGQIVVAASIDDASLSADSGATIDVDAASTFNSVVATGSTINLNESTTGEVEINEDSTLNLNNDAVLTGSLSLEDSTLNRSQDSNLVLLDFSISGGGTAAIREGDQVSESLSVSSGAEVDVFSILDLDSIRLADGAVLNLFYEMGQDAFLSTDSLEFVGQDSILNLFYDETELDFRELDLGIRVSGDQTTELQGLVDAGQIRFSGTPGLLSVFRDVQGFGDYTFVGVVGVPEPTSTCLLYTSPSPRD